eukprot:653626-Hanusia_phi.AAC.1
MRSQHLPATSTPHVVYSYSPVPRSDRQSFAPWLKRPATHFLLVYVDRHRRRLSEDSFLHSRALQLRLHQ